jgi:tRNA modification GTPase
LQRLSRVFAAFDSITAAARQGALLREGLNVVIAGKPNAGKSSLLNRLAGEDIAIVTEATRHHPRPAAPTGASRRPAGELIDTAGLRRGRVEEEGIRRAKVEMQRATESSTKMPPPGGRERPAQPAELPPGVPGHLGSE